jgi:simple sugar transport system ATP-binding protein
MMVGRPVDLKPKLRNAGSVGDVKLAVSGLQVLDDVQAPAVRGIDIAVRGGEVVGVAGVSGNGQKALMEALGGQRPIASGTVTVHGVAYTPTRREMRLHGFHCIPEEPLRNGSVPTMSVEDNLAARVFDVAPFSTAGVLHRRAITERARALIAEFRIRTSGPKARISDLSGGNVQRAVLARELVEGLEVLVVTNPCFGLDFNAIADIRGRIIAARDAGAAVLLISEDLDEILELSDRVLVMSEGRVVYETTPAAADLRVIGRHMAGAQQH